MKTIEEAVKENFLYKSYGYYGLCEESTHKKIFNAGVEFATKWIPVEEELPRIGEKVITRMDKDKRTSYGVATRIREEWEIDAHWIDHTFSNMTITHWRYIDLK